MLLYKKHGISAWYRVLYWRLEEWFDWYSGHDRWDREQEWTSQVSNWFKVQRLRDSFCGCSFKFHSNFVRIETDVFFILILVIIRGVPKFFLYPGTLQKNNYMMLKSYFIIVFYIYKVKLSNIHVLKKEKTSLRRYLGFSVLNT